MIQNKLLSILNNTGYITDNYINSILDQVIINNDVKTFKDIINLSNTGYKINSLIFSMEHDLEDYFIKILSKTSFKNIIYTISNNSIFINNIKWEKILYDNGIRKNIIQYMSHEPTINMTRMQEMYKYVYNKTYPSSDIKTDHKIDIFKSINYNNVTGTYTMTSCLLNRYFDKIGFVYNFITLPTFNTLLRIYSYIIVGNSISKYDADNIINLLQSLHSFNPVSIYDNIINIKTNTFSKLTKNFIDIIIQNLFNCLKICDIDSKYIEKIFLYLLNIFDNSDRAHEIKQIICAYIEKFNFIHCLCLTIEMMTLFNKYNILNKNNTLQILQNRAMYRNIELITFLYNNYNSDDHKIAIQSQSFAYANYKKLLTDLKITLDYDILQKCITKDNIFLYNYANRNHNYENVKLYLEHDLIKPTPILNESIRLGNQEIFQYIISKSYNLKINNNSALKKVCEYGRIDMIKYFKQYKCSFKNGILAKIAIEYANIDILKELLIQGCNINSNTTLYEICAKKII